MWVEDIPPHLVDVLFVKPGWFYKSNNLHSQKIKIKIKRSKRYNEVQLER